MNKMFVIREQLRSQSHRGTMGNLYSAQLTSPSEIYRAREEVDDHFRERLAKNTAF